MTTTSKQLPILISRNHVMFPHCSDTIEVGRAMSINAVNWAIANHKSCIIVVCQRNYENDDPQQDDVFKIGTLCTVQIKKREADDSIVVEFKGIQRVHLKNMLKKKETVDDKTLEMWTTEYSAIRDKNSSYLKNSQALGELLAQVTEVFGDNSKEVKKINEIIDLKPEKISVVVDICASLWPIESTEQAVEIKQKWLETTDVSERINLIISGSYMPSNAKEEIEDVINKKVHNNISKQQKEFYLRERIKVIKEELGENPAKEEELNKIRLRLRTEPFPEAIKEKIMSELNKLEYTSFFSNESMITKNYIDWVMSLPWWEMSTEEKNFQQVQTILNKNHYGLEKVKERILEFLAVQKRAKRQTGSIICFVGPPGVGKTSLAVSIAEALRKKFIKISLGGVSDEAEIRGHRKTYIGSMPGRIIKGLKNAKVKNPLFLLDEIDKLKSDYRGDPASALLEVLDPSQNQHFSDNYIEEEYDLSQVMFIATANYEDNIPPPLYDRMEIIHLTSYTAKEKLEIAKSHLLKEVFSENMIKENELKFKDEAISYIITHYTREAGVRNLKRSLASIARKYVLSQENKLSEKNEVIGIPEVIKYLKKEIFDENLKDEVVLPGVVNGMAYTEFGGSLLPIEVNYYPGKGNISITGNLRQTMSESVSVAMGYVKANAALFGIDHINFAEIDVNVHVPSGGIPKDGPSAGVTLTSALISAFRQQPVSSNIAMTGEITLRGKVLIIGGVKEKVISAVRAGVNKIFIPKNDERYLEDVPKEILDLCEIVLAPDYLTIFKEIFLSKQALPQKATKPLAKSLPKSKKGGTSSSVS